MKPILFFDFDNMLVDTDQMQRDFILREYGVQVPASVYLCGNSLCEIVNKLLPENKQVGVQEFYDHWCRNLVMSRELHKPVKPMDGALTYMPRIARRYDSWVITARIDEGRKVAEELCYRFFGDAISGMHFVSVRLQSGVITKGKSKKDFISDFVGEKVAFFDDNPGEVKATRGVIPSFLFDRTGMHQHDRDIKNCVRSWGDIGRLLL